MSRLLDGYSVDFFYRLQEDMYFWTIKIYLRILLLFKGLFSFFAGGKHRLILGGRKI
jgi:hypothetical protein